MWGTHSNSNRTGGFTGKGSGVWNQEGLWELCFTSGYTERFSPKRSSPVLPHPTPHRPGHIVRSLPGHSLEGTPQGSWELQCFKREHSGWPGTHRELTLSFRRTWGQAHTLFDLHTSLFFPLWLWHLHIKCQDGSMTFHVSAWYWDKASSLVTIYLSHSTWPLPHHPEGNQYKRFTKDWAQCSDSLPSGPRESLH